MARKREKSLCDDRELRSLANIMALLETATDAAFDNAEMLLVFRPILVLDCNGDEIGQLVAEGSEFRFKGAQF